MGRAPPDAVDHGAQQARQADRDHDHRDHRLADQGPQDQAFHDQADHRRTEERRQHAHTPGEAELADEGEGEVGAEEQELALREVDHVARLEDDDEADGHQRVDHAVREAGDGELKEDVGVHRPLLRR